MMSAQNEQNGSPIRLLQLPAAKTFLSKLLAPVIRAGVLWYVEAVVAQQNANNQVIAMQLGQLNQRINLLNQRINILNQRMSSMEEILTETLRVLAQERSAYSELSPRR